MFDFDFITLSIAMISIAAFTLPFYLSHRKIKARVAIAKKQMADFIKNQGIQIQVEDLWRNQYYIGLDPEKRKLIYTEDIAAASPVLIDLDGVRQVKIDEVSRNLVSQVNTRKIIDHLKLVFVGENGKVIDTLEFYDGDKYSDLSGETILIKNWETCIQNVLKNTPKKQLAQ